MGATGPIAILEFCGYGSLYQQLVKMMDCKAGAISELLVVKILVDLSAGLKACHDAGVVHLDMKTENCLVDASMNLKIADFGTSLFVDEEGMKSKYPSRGTKTWMSPEMKKKEPILTTKSDIWGLGCIMYSVCTLQQWINHSKPYDT